MCKPLRFPLGFAWLTSAVQHTTNALPGLRGGLRPTTARTKRPRQLIWNPAPNARSWSLSVSLVDLGRFPPLTSGTTAFLNAEKTGFSQVGFSVVCESCQSWDTQEKLSAAKFTGDAVLDPDDSSYLGVLRKVVYFL